MDSKRSKLKNSGGIPGIGGKQITRFYSGVDHHIYWTLVIDTTTTARDARKVISDKLGDDTVSPSSFSIVMEADNTVVTIGDNDRLLEVKSRFKKKKKKEDIKFVLQGLDIVNNNINYSFSAAPSPPASPVLNATSGPFRSQSASSSEDERPVPVGARLKGAPAKIAVVTNSAKAKKHLTLIHVFYNNHIYWTLAIDPSTTVEDVCEIIGEKLGIQDSRVTLHEVESEPEGAAKPTLASIPEHDSAQVNSNAAQTNEGAQSNGGSTTQENSSTHENGTIQDESDIKKDDSTQENGNPPQDTDINTSTSTPAPPPPPPPPPPPTIFQGLTNMAVSKLDDNTLICDVLLRWGKHTRSRFFVKEETADEDKKPVTRPRKGSTGPILVCASEEMPSLPDEEPGNGRPRSTTLAPLRPVSASFAPLRPVSSSFAPINPEDQRKNPINMWIRESEIKLVKKISSGAFAKVFKGVYKDTLVAIKVLKGSLTEENIVNFKHEFAILSQIHSPNLVSFYGACIEKKLTMVMEYCPHGTLYHVMKDPNEEIGWKRVIDFFTQTVRGIDCLHHCTPPILHRDLKSLNLLVSENWEVKVADFGLSRFNTISNHSSLGRICGTMAYCAPEVYKGERFGVKSDIYSLGIILWELVVRCISKQYKAPYSEYPFISFDFQIIIQTSQNGLRPTIPPECPPVIAALMQHCWHGDPDSRPSCDEILKALDAVREEMEKDPTGMGFASV